MTEVWPWFALAGLGMFHGVNPAMGWLFAVALGLHQRSRAVVLIALIPIAIGHAAAVAMVVFAVLALDMFIDECAIRIASGGVLIAWAFRHWLFGARHRVRFGMQVGMIGLAMWSLLMATAHGAGLMLVPVLIPLCLSPTAAQELTASGSLLTGLAAVGVHTFSMLATTCLVAVAVYEYCGLAFLRRGWINLDLIWTMALLGTGLILVAT
jgi:hypothetical protein